jgi:PHD finger-like domain-containing protein 5A
LRCHKIPWPVAFFFFMLRGETVVQSDAPFLGHRCYSFCLLFSKTFVTFSEDRCRQIVGSLSCNLLHTIMAKHHPDLIFCRKQPGIAIGRLCEKCDGKCVICDSYVRPCTLVRVCDECNYGSFQGRCVICGAPGISDAYYCKECTILEKDVRPPPTKSCSACPRGLIFVRLALCRGKGVRRL